ncbi:MAG: exodeoxyribonuclease VII large subunit [Clostridia bacterium]|nr:exodeoxyribonuclease VII large subunit [Clostridia bacterium]
MAKIVSRGPLTLTVSELNEYVRRSLAGDPMLHGISLRGEISNMKRHISGHWYFTLKDAQSAVNCAMFRQAALTAPFIPRDGQQVRLFGSAGLYTKTGQYQFYVDAMERDGVGEMYARFEELKQRLTREGIFDPALKKPIPLLPRGVGIVTSKTGSVIHDMARVSWRRNPGMPLFLCPVKVQGTGAAAEVAEGIATMERFEGVDVIIVGRGGGSTEDLWAFNEEEVARAIFACGKPIISAVGHETDVTLADFAADLRAPTPSAAAELAVQPRKELLGEVFHRFLKLERAFQLKIKEMQIILSSLDQRLTEQDPERQRQLLWARVQQADGRLHSCTVGMAAEKAHALAQCEIRLRAAGPMATIARGYTMVLKDGSLTRSVDQVRPGDSIRILMQDGEVTAGVTEVRKGEPQWRVK